jgi:hypothetical protein
MPLRQADKIIFGAIILWVLLLVLLFHKTMLVNKELDREIKKSEDSRKQPDLKKEKAIPVMKTKNFEYILL